MFAAPFGFGQSGKHPGQFGQSMCTVDVFDVSGLAGSPDCEVRVGEGSNLGKVCDAHDLTICCQLRQLLPHGECRRAADSGIDLVERNDRCVSCTGCKCEGQNQSTQLPT